MDNYELDVKEDEDGELVIEFPEELMKAQNWEIGDAIRWIDNLDGTFTLSKKVNGKMNNINIEEEFDNWCRESEHIPDSELHDAYIAGARKMSQDTLDTLQDYSTAVCGLNEKCYNSNEAFGVAHKNLKMYYEQILKNT